MSFPREEKYKAKMCGYYAVMEGRTCDPASDFGLSLLRTDYDIENRILEVYYGIGYLMGYELIHECDEASSVMDINLARSLRIKKEIERAFDLGMQAAFSAVEPFPREDERYLLLAGDLDGTKEGQTRDAALHDAWEEGYESGLDAMDGAFFEAIVKAQSLNPKLSAYRKSLEEKNGRIYDIFSRRRKE